jgi:hypothetical protein
MFDYNTKSGLTTLFMGIGGLKLYVAPFSRTGKMPVPQKFNVPTLKKIPRNNLGIININKK